MSPIQSAVFSALSGFAGLSALSGQRVYADEAPQNTAVPYVVWQEITDVESNDLDGSAETGGLHNFRIQVTFWDRTATKSREGDRQARLAMIAGFGARSLAIDRRALPYEPQAKLYGMQSDFSVWLKT